MFKSTLDPLPTWAVVWIIGPDSAPTAQLPLMETQVSLIRVKVVSSAHKEEFNLLAIY